MKKKNPKLIKEQLDKLAMLCLENNGNKTDYSDDELADATTIFMEVLSNKMFDEWKDKATPEELFDLAERLGKDLRVMLKETTGVDMHDVYKNVK